MGKDGWGKMLSEAKEMTIQPHYCARMDQGETLSSIKPRGFPITAISRR